MARALLFILKVLLWIFLFFGTFFSYRKRKIVRKAALQGMRTEVHYFTSHHPTQYDTNESSQRTMKQRINKCTVECSAPALLLLNS